MNITEQAINRLIKYYSLSNAAQLANKFEITQGVVSNWKTRNAIGALVDTVNNKDPNALEYIFSNENINNFQNSKNNVAQIFGGENTNTQHNYNSDKKANNTVDVNILKLIEMMYSYASEHNKIDELKTDLSALLPKYM
jgi:hypothetical protein